MKIKKTLKERINKTESSLLAYYENPQLKARDEKMVTLIFNRRMLLNQLFKPTDENYQLLKEFNETLNPSLTPLSPNSYCHRTCRVFLMGSVSYKFYSF